MSLPTAVLGRTGLEVTRLGYGAAHHRPMTNDEARAVHAAVVDRASTSSIRPTTTATAKS